MKTKISIWVIAVLVCLVSTLAFNFDLNGNGYVDAPDIVKYQQWQNEFNPICYNDGINDILCSTIIDSNNDGLADFSLELLQGELSNPTNNGGMGTQVSTCTLGILGNGDFNSNGFIEPSDIVSLQSLISSNSYDPIGDLNGDCSVDSYDLQVLQNGYSTPLAKCADGIDNDGDNLIDMNDPGCMNNGVYDPSDNDETEPISTVIVTPSTGGSSGGSGRCKDVTEEGIWGPCLDNNGVGIRYRTDIVYECGNKFDANKVTVSESCELTEVITQPTETTQETSDGSDVTGDVVLDINNQNTGIYWLIALGIIILSVGGVLYFKEIKK